MRLLVVDDEARARERRPHRIEELDEHEVIAEAGDRAAAIRAGYAHKPDVALLDVRRPGTDGLEAAHHLAVMDPPFEAHAVDYLIKPPRGGAWRSLWRRHGAQRGRNGPQSTAARCNWLGSPMSYTCWPNTNTSPSTTARPRS